MQGIRSGFRESVRYWLRWHLRLGKLKQKYLIFPLLVIFIVLVHLVANNNSYDIKTLTETYSKSDVLGFKGSIFDLSHGKGNKETISDKQDMDVYVNISREVKYPRKLFRESPFQYLTDIMNKYSKTEESLAKINSIKDGFTMDQWEINSVFSTLDQCKILIDAIYSIDNDWHNLHDIVKNETYRKSGDDYLSTFVERLRIYNYCFQFNSLDPSDIFEYKESNHVDLSGKYSSNIAFTAKEFQYRMFPFLKVPQNDEALLPKIVHVNTMKPVQLNLTRSVKEHNENFWQSWSSLGEGKGIVTTFPESNGDFFLRELEVLKVKENTLPIQVLVNENELSHDFIQKLSQKAIVTGQQVYVITFTSLLNKEVEEYGSRFKNKLYASLFNTFEEFIILDADVVTFLNPEEYFGFEEYQSSGLYISRDRRLNMLLNRECLNSIKYLEPTLEEVRLIGSSTRYTLSAINDTTATGEAFRVFARDHISNIAESGLVTISKRKSMAGLLLGTMLRFSSTFEGCAYGDKEFFWMGPLYAGINYEFEPSDAALMGFPKKEYDNDWHYIKTTLCDSHIAHAHKGRLIWTNGCMTMSKNIDPNRPNPRMKANGFLIPDYKRSNLDGRQTKFGYMFCSHAVEAGGLEDPHGYVGWMDQETYLDFENISIAWNKD